MKCHPTIAASGINTRKSGHGSCDNIYVNSLNNFICSNCFIGVVSFVEATLCKLYTPVVALIKHLISHIHTHIHTYMYICVCVSVLYVCMYVGPS